MQARPGLRECSATFRLLEYALRCHKDTISYYSILQRTMTTTYYRILWRILNYKISPYPKERPRAEGGSQLAVRGASAVAGEVLLGLGPGDCVL